MSGCKRSAVSNPANNYELQNIINLITFKTLLTMKNITKVIAMAMLSTMSISTFTSCSEDVDVLSINGTWRHDDTRDNEFDYISFSENGAGSKWEVSKADPTATMHDFEEFSYTLKGNKITIIERDGDRDVETVKIISDKQIKLDGEVYDRQ